jgi:PilZ domain
MYEKKRRSDRVQMSMPIRVRGMSSANKFFDEESTTEWISQHGVMTHLHSLVDLESEVHVTCLKSMVGGTFRVAWVNTHALEGAYNIGLEIVDTEGDLWGIHFPPTQPEDDSTAPRVWLQCQRCRESEKVPVPEAEVEHLSEGFLIARPCERCKATTTWEFAVEAEILPAEDGGKGTAPKSTQKNQRDKGRVPMKTRIKVTYQRFGTPIEDVCETTDVSRGGVCFLTSATYEVGEKISVVVPYKEGDVAIPVPARVVRTDFMKGGNLRAVAAQMERAR